MRKLGNSTSPLTWISAIWWDPCPVVSGTGPRPTTSGVIAADLQRVPVTTDPATLGSSEIRATHRWNGNGTGDAMEKHGTLHMIIRSNKRMENCWNGKWRQVNTGDAMERNGTTHVVIRRRDRRVESCNRLKWRPVRRMENKIHLPDKQ